MTFSGLFFSLPLTPAEKYANLYPMDELIKLKNELERSKLELAVLYEISNGMRTTLKLDEILYIILTGVTSHVGLGFNRALLFLVNEKEGIIEGKMGIGPGDGAEANRIWKQIEHEKMDLDDLISVYKFASNNILEMGFNRQVQSLKVSLSDKSQDLLSLVALEGMPLHLTPETIEHYRGSQIVSMLNVDELALVPLKAKDKVNGIIVADNFINKEPITKDDLRLLIMLANQAGLAIENSQLYEKTELRAHSDSLTELWNHGYFQYLFLSELERSKATHGCTSLMMVDIDDFKVYNDSLGHQAGDAILKELAVLLKNQSRKMDAVCRYGGEEFTVILPQTDKPEAFAIAERLRQEIHKKHFSHEEILPHKRLTVSIGIASYPADAPSANELIALCDKALYQAKRRGKNNSCCEYTP